MSPIRHLPATAALLAGLAAIAPALAQSSDGTDPNVDALERQLELGRHGRLLARIADGDATLTAFSTDGCSGGLSASWSELAARFPAFAERHGGEPPWQRCCVEHDRRYHAGGARSRSAADSFEQRKGADLELAACVVETGAERSAELRELYPLSEAQVEGLYKAIAEVMYRAVRLGGVPCTSEPWRWGYGWPLCL